LYIRNNNFTFVQNADIVKKHLKEMVKIYKGVK